MDWTIVLDRKTHTLTQEGTRAESRMMYIPPGQVGIISMYNMVEEAVIEGVGADAVIVTKGCARILKVSVARSKNLPELLSCGQVIALDREHEKLLAERKITKEPMFQCGQEWNISPCNNMQVIKTIMFLTTYESNCVLKQPTHAGLSMWFTRAEICQKFVK